MAARLFLFTTGFGMGVFLSWALASGHIQVNGNTQKFEPICPPALTGKPVVVKKWDQIKQEAKNE